MTDVVLDASSLAEYVVASPTGREIFGFLDARRPAIHVPHLCIVETLSALRGWVRRGELSLERAEGAVEDLHGFPARKWSADPFIDRIWELRDNVSSYDASYVALAESLDAVLVTSDGRLARGAGDHGDCEVRLFPRSA